MTFKHRSFITCLSVCALAGMFLTGCAPFQGDDASGRALTWLVRPELSYYGKRGAICIMSFTAPEEASGMGLKAARAFYHESLSRGIFQTVVFDEAHTDIPEESYSEPDSHYSGNMIVSGRLSYYYDGSTLQPSRVDIEVNVFNIVDGRPLVIWRAAVVEISRPSHYKDYFLFESQGRRASRTNELFRGASKKLWDELERNMIRKPANYSYAN